MRKTMLALSVASLLSTTPCVAFEWPDFSTTYKHNTFFRGGYQESQLGQDVFQVTFSGNSFTPKKKALRCALVRAAEVAHKNGDSYFTILDKIDDAQNYTHTTTSGLCLHDSFTGLFGYSFLEGAATSSTFSSPSYTITVKTFKETPQNQNYLTVSDVLSANADLLKQRNK